MRKMRKTTQPNNKNHNKYWDATKIKSDSFTPLPISTILTDLCGSVVIIAAIFSEVLS